MKLPANKKTRTQMFLLAALLAAAALWGLWIGVAAPLRRTGRMRQGRIVTLRTDIQTAERRVRQMAADEEANAELIARIASEDAYVLHSRLGNYLLSATEAIDAVAREAAVDIEAITEVGVSVRPEKTDQKVVRALNLYTANVKLRAGLHDLVRLLETASAANPYLAVTGVEIAARPATPGRHEISLALQWPIWNDADGAPQLARTLSVPPAIPDGETLPLPNLLDEAPAAAKPQGDAP
jgi:hypothetical protein